MTGAGLPHKGTKWASKQIIKTTWFPGNSRASQQVLGPQQPSTTFSGKWSVVQLATCPVQLTQDNTNFLVVRPDVIMEFFEEMLAGGALLQVTWAAQAIGGNDVQIVRVGRLSQVEWTPDTIHDVPWELTFDWVGRTGTTGQSVVSTRDDNTADATSLNAALSNAASVLAALNVVASNNTLGSFLSQYQAFFGQVGGFISSGGSPAGAFIPPPASATSVGTAEALADGPSNIVTLMQLQVQAAQANAQQIAATIASTSGQPSATANLYVEFSNLAVVQANSSLDQLSAIPPDLMSNNSDAMSVILAMNTFGQAWEATLSLSGAAKDLELKSRSQVSNNPGGAKPSVMAASFLSGSAPLAIHTCRQGDTAVSLSVRYYNSPDLVSQILKANGLPGWTVMLDPGKQLVIPAFPKAA
jgi:hypothetical protein